MPEIRLTRYDDGTPLVLDCCDDRYDVDRILVDDQVRIAVVDKEKAIVIVIRETNAEMDAIMRVAHPNLSVEAQS